MVVQRPWHKKIDKVTRQKIWVPVEWLTLNGSRRDPRAHAALAKKWRTAAYEAAMATRLPRGLDRVHLTVEIRKLTAHRKDQGNHEPTLKAIVDGAIGPTRPGYWRAGKWVEPQLGWGVVADDDQTHVVRDPEVFGEPLGMKSKIKGLVILTIRPLPPP